MRQSGLHQALEAVPPRHCMLGCVASCEFRALKCVSVPMAASLPRRAGSSTGQARLSPIDITEPAACMLSSVGDLT